MDDLNDRWGVTNAIHPDVPLFLFAFAPVLALVRTPPLPTALLPFLGLGRVGSIGGKRAAQQRE
jgi:hypothetical protein